MLQTTNPRSTRRALNSPPADPPLRRRRGRQSRPLGPIAHIVLRIVDALPKGQASGTTVEYHASNHLGEIMDISQIYVTLGRLEERSLLETQEARSSTGSGHTVTVYTVTDAGREALAQSIAFYDKLVSPPLLQKGWTTDEEAQTNGARSSSTTSRTRARTSGLARK